MKFEKNRTWILRLSCTATVSLLALSTSGFARDFSVDAVQGQESNDGISAPWKSLRAVNAYAKKPGFLPGDRILLTSGQIFRGNILMVKPSSRQEDVCIQPAAPIVIQSSGEKPATLQFDRDLAEYDHLTVLNGTGRGNDVPTLQQKDTAGIYFRNQGQITIENVILKGEEGNRHEGTAPPAKWDDTYSGLQIVTDISCAQPLSQIHVSRLEVSGFGGDGIDIRGLEGPLAADRSKKKGFDQISISHVDSHDNGGEGIHIWQDYVDEVSNLVKQADGSYRLPPITYSHRHVVVDRSTVHHMAGSGILLQDVDGAVVEHNTAYENGADSDGNVGIWCWNSRSIVIQFNESYRNHNFSGADGDGFDLDGQVVDSVIQYNYSHENDGAGYLFAEFGSARDFRNNTIRYNLSVDDDKKGGYGAITLWSDKDNNWDTLDAQGNSIFHGEFHIEHSSIYNNTVFLSEGQTSAYAMSFFDGLAPTDVKIFNNIFVAPKGAKMIDTETSLDQTSFEKNDYWESGPVPVSSGEYSLDPGFSAPGAVPTLNGMDQLAALTAYQLGAQSPLIGVGRNTGVKERDLIGTEIDPVKNPDLGAVSTTVRESL